MFCFYPKDEVRADTSDWSALGMHGNQSGPIICETTLTKDRVVGPFGKTVLPICLKKFLATR